MLFELPITNFLQEMYRLHNSLKSGVVVFRGEKSKLGKIYFDQGTITMLSYDTLKGSQVFPALKALESVEFNFREKQPVQVHSEPITDEFFLYFNIETPSITKQGKQTVVEKEEPYQPLDSGLTASSEILGSAKILIADDSGVARKALSRVLIEAGYDVIEAKDGHAALEQLQHEQPDMMFLDLIMPNIDGYHVLDMIERTPELKKIPIVILTSRDSLLDKFRGKLSKCDAYLTKPVPSDLLLRTVEKHLD